jgi:hypothetical protein
MFGADGCLSVFLRVPFLFYDEVSTWHVWSLPCSRPRLFDAVLGYAGPELGHYVSELTPQLEKLDRTFVHSSYRASLRILDPSVKQMSMNFKYF